MSLERRLRQGLEGTAREMNVEADLDVARALAAVIDRAEATRRHRIVLVAAAAATAAAVALAAPRVAEILLSVDEKLPPAKEEQERKGSKNRRDRSDRARIGRDDGTGRGRGGDGAPLVGFAAPVGRRSADERPPAEEPVSRPQQPEKTRSGSHGEPREPADPDAPPGSRSASAQYGAADSAAAESGTAVCDSENKDACFWFPSQDGERYVSVTVDDAVGGSVFFWVQQDVDGDGDADGDWRKSCDSTSDAVRIAPGAIVRVLLDSGPCPDGSDPNPSTGTIRVTFSS